LGNPYRELGLAAAAHRDWLGRPHTAVSFPAFLVSLALAHIANWGNAGVRVAVRALYVIALVLVILATADGVRLSHGHIIPQGTLITVLAGLWFFSALFAFLAVILVHSLDRLWTLLRRFVRSTPASAQHVHASSPAAALHGSVELLRDPSRRYFFKSATAVAGVSPFLCAAYGFAAERLKYKIRRVEIPIANLPPRSTACKSSSLAIFT